MPQLYFQMQADSIEVPLGWEWLADCLSEESTPEPESPPLGHLRAVFSNFFL